MRTTQRIITALTATLLLAMAVGTASARNLSTSNQGVRATWTSLEFDTGIGIVIRCQVTLEGSFHARTMPKVARTLAGAITRAIFKQETCSNGRGGPFNGTERYNGGTPSNTLPWHMTYESFIGRLPNIEGIRLLLSRFRLGADIEGTCTGQYGTATDNITAVAAREAGGGITGVTPVETLNRISLFRVDAGGFCPATATARGTGGLVLLNSASRITITLI